MATSYVYTKSILSVNDLTDYLSNFKSQSNVTNLVSVGPLVTITFDKALNDYDKERLDTYIDDYTGDQTGNLVVFSLPLPELFNAESIQGSSTTSSIYQNKLVATTPALFGGTYRVSWSYQIIPGDANKDYRVKLSVDGSTIQEDFLSASRITNTLSESGIRQINLTPGPHTFLVQYLSGSGSVTIQRVTLNMFRSS